jgi:predicted flap endonuclease-1-like 5' DNA nuclease
VAQEPSGRLRRAAQIFDEVRAAVPDHRASTYALMERYRAEGLLNEDLIAHLMEQTRSLNQQIRKLRMKTDEIRQAPLNFKETLPDGSVAEYNKAIEDTTPDRLRRIFASAARVRERRSVYEDAAARAKGAKKALEAEQEEHETLLSELEREAAAEHESLPLFPADTAAPEPPADDAWRHTPLADLGLPPAIVETLTEAELTTFGQLADWTAAGKELTDIPRIGPAKAEKIEDAFFAYWSGRVAPVEFTAVQPPPDALPDDAEDDPAGD